MSDTIDKALLRQLADEWFSDVDDYDSNPGLIAAMTEKACAKELQYVLENEEMIEDADA